MSRTKQAPAKTKKPHRMAQRLDTPCEKCGSEWGRTGIVIDHTAEEMKMSFLCANPACMRTIAED